MMDFDLQVKSTGLQAHTFKRYDRYAYGPNAHAVFHFQLDKFLYQFITRP